MSPYIELIVFFGIMVLSFGAMGIVYFIVACAAYFGLLYLMLAQVKPKDRRNVPLE